MNDVLRGIFSQARPLLGLALIGLLLFSGCIFDDTKLGNNSYEEITVADLKSVEVNTYGESNGLCFRSLFSDECSSWQDKQANKEIKMERKKEMDSIMNQEKIFCESNNGIYQAILYTSYIDYHIGNCWIEKEKNIVERYGIITINREMKLKKEES